MEDELDRSAETIRNSSFFLLLLFSIVIRRKFKSLDPRAVAIARLIQIPRSQPLKLGDPIGKEEKKKAKQTPSVMKDVMEQRTDGLETCCLIAS